MSNAYGLTNVPTLFWIAPSGEIEVTSVAWVRAEVEAIMRRAAEVGAISSVSSGAVVAPSAVFYPGEAIPEFRAG